MVRKVMFFSLAIVLALAGTFTVASAAQNVANTSQKGSLLIFPKILVQGEIQGAGLKAPGSNLGQIPGLADTVITIGNDYYTEVWVKCYWVDENQDIEDFMFRLTPNQPIVFDAASGYGDMDITVPPFVGRGELKCWAVNAAGDQQISFNHLYGNAVIMAEGLEQEGAVIYNAWSFAAKPALNQPVGTGGNLQLTGAAGGYDACPQYLVTNFFPASPNDGMRDVNPDLTLVPCRQDLRQDRTPTCTKAKFDVWNANETKFTGAYQCLKCWYEGFLHEIGAPTGFGGDKFSGRALKTDIARFRVQSASNAACKASIPECAGISGVLTPFVGVLFYAARYEDGLGPNAIIPYAGTTPFTAGLDGSGFVLWDPAGSNPEAPLQ
jgi:hypothetical protein